MNVTKPYGQSGLIEQKLVERTLDGDESAAREMYDANVDRVFRLSYRMTGDEDQARECAQEVFIRAFERLHQFRGDAALSTWLHSITVSATLTRLRKLKRTRGREVELDPDLDSGQGGRPGLAEPDLKQRLDAAINGLPDIYRMVFVMHDVEGFTHEEIGKMLDVATGTSKARLCRAKRMLREELADFAQEYAA